MLARNNSHVHPRKTWAWAPEREQADIRGLKIASACLFSGQLNKEDLVCALPLPVKACAAVQMLFKSKFPGHWDRMMPGLWKSQMKQQQMAWEVTLNRANCYSKRPLDTLPLHLTTAESIF